MPENVTAISYVNNKRGIKSEFSNEISKELWVWCTSKNISVSAAQVSETENTEADSFSGNFNEAIEWKLNTLLFQKLYVCLETKH